MSVLHFDFYVVRSSSAVMVYIPFPLLSEVSLPLPEAGRKLPHSLVDLCFIKYLRHSAFYPDIVKLCTLYGIVTIVCCGGLVLISPAGVSFLVGVSFP